MSGTDRPRGRAGRPAATSREQILATARRIIDEHGWEKLTVRKLAAELGIGAATLYHHVRDRDDLLVQLLNDHTERLPRPDLPDDPRDRIIAAAKAMHDALTVWPVLAEALTVDGFLGRLNASALWPAETIVTACLDHGRTTAQAVDIFRSIWYFTVGEILVRARSGRRRAVDGFPANRDTFFVSPDVADLPRLAELGDRWPVLAARDIYPHALVGIVDGLLAQAASTPE